MKIVHTIRWIPAFVVWCLLLLLYLPIGLIGKLDNWLNENETMNRYVSWVSRVIQPLRPKDNDSNNY